MFRQKKRQDKRTTPRWTIDRFLAVYDQDKTVFLGRVEDLSLGGMCVVGSECPPADRHLKLALEVLAGDGTTETLYLRCRILWVSPEEDSELYRVGVGFSGNSPAVTKAIARLISEQSLSTVARKPGR